MKQNSQTILSFFQNKYGFHFDDEKKKRLDYLLANRIKKMGMTNERQYFDYICSKRGKHESQFMVAAFTVGETYFLRNSSHWKALKHKILPEILKRKLQRNEKSLRIWSAGCSSGEESYTIAILLSEHIPYYHTWSIDILATDINESSLKHAKKGIYTENAFRESSDDFKSKFFSQYKGKYRIQNHFRKMITFEQLNLITDNGFPKHYSCFDIIFCRNVLMYFSPKIASDIMSAMFNALNINGYIFLGHTEGPITNNFNFKPLSLYNSIVYQKQNISSAPCRIERSRKNNLQQAQKINRSNSLNSLNTNQRIKTCVNNSQKNYYDEALHLFSIGKIDDAQAVLNKHNENQNLYCLLLVGLIYIQKRDFQSAQVIFKEAQLIHDLTPETYMLGAMIHEEMNLFPEAINGCRNAIFLDQTFFYPHFRLVEIYRIMGDHEKMQKSVNNALKILPVENSDRLKLFCVGYNKEFLEDYLKSIS